MKKIIITFLTIAIIFIGAIASYKVIAGNKIEDKTYEFLETKGYIKDDILDYSDVEDIGKPTMNDIRDGKATLPLLISLQRANGEEANHIREIAEGLAAQSPHIDVFEAEQEIKSFVLRYDGIRYAHQEMEKHRKKALDERLRL